MNRAPGKGDTWWSKHQAECGGTYKKISEPELTKKQLQSLSGKERAGRQKNKLDTWITASRKNTNTEGDASDKPIATNKEFETFPTSAVEDAVRLSSFNVGQKRPRADTDDDIVRAAEKKTLVECPICDMRVADTEINEHLDVLHP